MPWEERPIEFTFNLGFVNLGTAWVDGLLQTGHFSRFDEQLRRQPPAELSASGRRVAHIPSCPVDEGEPLVSLVAGHLRYIACRYPHYYVSKGNDSFEVYLGRRLSKRTRKSLRQSTRRLAKATNSGELEWRVFSALEEVDRAHADASAVACRTYQERWLKESLPSREQARALAERDTLRVYLLYFDGRPISYLWCRRIDDVELQELAGYDQQYAKYAPGAVLDFLVLEHLFADEKIRVIDLTEGEGEHKRKFATDNQLCGEVYYLRPTPANLALLGAHLSFTQAYERARKQLADSAIRRLIRKLLQQQAAG